MRLRNCINCFLSVTTTSVIYRCNTCIKMQIPKYSILLVLLTLLGLDGPLSHMGLGLPEEWCNGLDPFHACSTPVSLRHTPEASGAS